MRLDDEPNFAEFDTLTDPRDVAARDDAMAFDRHAQEAAQRRDTILRRLRRTMATNSTIAPLHRPRFDVLAASARKKT
jgi:hypothetical protein